MSIDLVSSRPRRGTLQVGNLAGGGSAHLSFLREGQGRPVLLLHGFASDAVEDWVETGWFAVLVTAGYDVIAPDLRGHGRSMKSCDPADYRLDAFATDIAALCEHCWGDHRFSLIGYSMGAHVAMSVALASVGRVESLILGGMGDRIAATVGLAPEFADALDAPDDDRRKPRPTSCGSGGIRPRVRSTIWKFWLHACAGSPVSSISNGWRRLPRRRWSSWASKTSWRAIRIPLRRGSRRESERPCRVSITPRRSPTEAFASGLCCISNATSRRSLHARRRFRKNEQ